MHLRCINLQWTCSSFPDILYLDGTTLSLTTEQGLLRESEKSPTRKILHNFETCFGKIHKSFIQGVQGISQLPCYLNIIYYQFS